VTIARNRAGSSAGLPADAVRFERTFGYRTDTEVAGYSEPAGVWTTPAETGFDGGATRSSLTTGAKAQWLTALPSGTYKAFIWRMPGGASSQQIAIISDAGVTKKTVNFSGVDAAAWHQLGTYTFSSGVGKIVATKNAGGAFPMRADAVCFQPQSFGKETGNIVTLSGTVTYDRVPATGSGLNYGGIVEMPVRGAALEVRNSSGTKVLFRTTTDADGDYLINAPANANVMIAVLAEAGSASNPNTRVVDNSKEQALYAMYQNHATGLVNETGVDLNADSGWTGSSYGNPRTSAPFAIFDTVHQAREMVKAADPDISFPQLLVNWCPANSFQTIGGSHYNGEEIYIMGKVNQDTDEFDDHVIAHEWGHYFEDNFSRADNLGGAHGFGDVLDETVAFGEGFGNAFSGMATQDPLYLDIYGPGQAEVGVEMNLEADEVPDDDTFEGGLRLLDGAWSEDSVQELLFDLFDGGDGMADADADGINLGFAPLYDILTGPQKTTTGFTTIYSFMQHLKNQQAGIAGDITDLEAEENILAHDKYEQTGAGRARYTDLPEDEAVTFDVDDNGLTTYNTYGAIGRFGGNKLYNRLLFKAQAPFDGTFRVTASPILGSHDLAIRRGGGKTPKLTDKGFIGAETVDFSAAFGETVTFSVHSFPTSNNPSGVTPFSIKFETLSISSDEQDPPLPRANG
jgi:hypothetical protein